jgi:hypothetical protein
MITKNIVSRRQALQNAAVGFGAMALNSILQGDRLFAAESAGARERIYDVLPKPPMFPAKAKRVIFIYIGGGPSTIDMYDPKPTLVKYDGKPAPFEIKGRALNGSQQIMASPWKFQQSGASGRHVSDLLPHFQKVVDKVTFVRSMTTDRIDHSTAQFTFVTGRGFTGFPSIGSWVNYALGTENQNLPGYIALGQGATIGDRAHSSAWLPPIYNGTGMRADPQSPIYDIKRPEGVSLDQQKRFLSMVGDLNRIQKGNSYVLDQDLESRIANYELAARMQVEALRVADIDQESEATKKLYGIDQKVGGPFGRLCLMARRLAEKDVRFIQIYGGGGGNWDTHNNIEGQLPGLCEYIDQGMSGLLTDLEQRGMLKDTLVVWSGEFGRLPTIEAKNAKPGRDHNPYGFSMWMAGAGLKPGFDYGQTDDLGYAAVQDKCTHADIHATVQHLLGIDYQKNTFPYEGRNESLVGVSQARVLKELFA